MKAKVVVGVPTHKISVTYEVDVWGARRIDDEDIKKYFMVAGIASKVVVSAHLAKGDTWNYELVMSRLNKMPNSTMVKNAFKTILAKMDQRP